ncbi:MAG TPA: cysteine desulfurase family protein, partial [Acidimicrobiia bacterium]|nr:cysteine desulfurase family protein [Acidimicrobiia bacterium]
MATTAYLDYAASTPVRPEAVEAMRPFLADVFGNPSGMHDAARRAKTALEEAREQVADALGAQPREVVFTGGGTEADNLAVKGTAWAAREQHAGDTIVVTAFEHHGVLGPAERLEREGFHVRHVKVLPSGVVDLDHLAASVDESTAVVSVMLVNNEVGTIQPLDEVVRIVRERAPRAVVHTDAVQAVPWLDVAAATAAVDLVAISAHKFGGPKGVGALVVRDGVRLVPVIDGGGQEMGRRSGTHNMSGIVGMAAALGVTTAARPAEVERVSALRDRLAAGLAEAVPDAFFNGDDAHRVAG